MRHLWLRQELLQRVKGKTRCQRDSVQLALFWEWKTAYAKPHLREAALVHVAREPPVYTAWEPLGQGGGGWELPLRLELHIIPPFWCAPF